MFRDIYNPAYDGDYDTRVKRAAMEKGIESRMRDMSDGQKTMLKAVLTLYSRNMRERSAFNGEERAWVSRTELAAMLHKPRLYRYHLKQLEKLRDKGFIMEYKRARLVERVDWLGERHQRAAGYEIIYRPLPEVYGAIKAITARKKSAATKPAPAPRAGLLDRLRDTIGL